MLSGVPADVDTLVFPNYESLPERDDVRHPFLEVTLFKKNYAHVLSGGRWWGRGRAVSQGALLCLAVVVLDTGDGVVSVVGGWAFGVCCWGERRGAQQQEMDGATGIAVVLTRPAPVLQTCTSSRTAWWRAATPTTS